MRRRVSIHLALLSLGLLVVAPEASTKTTPETSESASFEAAGNAKSRSGASAKRKSRAERKRAKVKKSKKSKDSKNANNSKSPKNSKDAENAKTAKSLWVSVMSGKLPIMVHRLDKKPAKMIATKVQAGKVYQAKIEKQKKTTRLGHSRVMKLYHLLYGEDCKYPDDVVDQPNWDPLELSYMLVWAPCAWANSLCFLTRSDRPEAAKETKAMTVIPASKSAALQMATNSNPKMSENLIPVILFGTRAKMELLRKKMQTGYATGLANPTPIPKSNWANVNGTKTCVKSGFAAPGRTTMVTEQWFNYRK